MERSLDLSVIPCVQGTNFILGLMMPQKLANTLNSGGANHSDVKEFIAHEKNTRHIDNNTEVFKEMFHREYHSVEGEF
jgi:hypothetical protein